MLVLTRRTGESIMLNNDVELKVLKIKGSQVHIGIQAPAEMTVHRKEVWERIQREQEDASHGAAIDTPSAGPHAAAHHHH